jgi:tetratricopeptide (TPR) repeat protein
VFAASFSLDAAQEVILGDPIGREQVPDLVEALIERSLIQVDPATVSSRGRLLDTIRHYAAGRLEESGEADAWRAAHAAWIARRVDAVGHTPDTAEALAALDPDLDNLRAALAWATSHRPETAVRLAAGLIDYWEGRGLYREGQRWLSHAVEAAPNLEPRDRALATYGLGRLGDVLGEFTQAGQLLEEALSVARAIGDGRLSGRILAGLASLRANTGAYDEAAVACNEALELARSQHDSVQEAKALWMMGVLAMYRTDFDEARRLLRASAAANHGADRRTAAKTTASLGGVDLLAGDASSALGQFADALAASREVGDRYQVAWCAGSLAFAYVGIGEPDPAREFMKEAFEMDLEMGDVIGMEGDIRTAASLAAAQGHGELAAELFGAAAARRDDSGLVTPTAIRRFIANEEALAIDLIGVDKFLLARARGQTLAIAEVRAKVMNI